MSPITRLVFREALSTALMPFTLTAPPADGLMLSQPARSGWQLTVGMVTAERALRLGVGTLGRINGMALALSGDVACPLAAGLAEACAVDGVENGPESSEQPGEVQPVAAGPTKVGAAVPRLDEETAVVAALATGAADAPPAETTSATGSANSDSITNDLRTNLLGMANPPAHACRPSPAVPGRRTRLSAPP
jgi:hypothetical protein